MLLQASMRRLAEVSIKSWLQSRPKRRIEPWTPPSALSPLLQKRREDLQKPKPSERQSINEKVESEPQAAQALEDMKRSSGKHFRRLELTRPSPSFCLGQACCQCGEVTKSFETIAAELEFSLWGTCSKCQDEIFLCHTGDREPEAVVVAPGTRFEALSPFHAVPLSSDGITWSSPFHLFMALHFVDPRCREILSRQSDASSLKRSVTEMCSKVRDDWHAFAVKAMRHVLFLALEQHPRLAALLCATQTRRILFASENLFWGADLERAKPQGANLVGKFLEEKRATLCR